MPFVDRLIHLMQTQQCERLVVENDQEFVFYRPDGSLVATTERLSRTLISDLLNEIMPEQYRSQFAAGVPFRFPYYYGSNVLDIEVDQALGSIRLSLLMVRTPSAQVHAQPMPAQSEIPLAQAGAPSFGGQADVPTPLSLPDSTPLSVDIPPPAYQEQQQSSSSVTPPASESPQPPSVRSNAAFPLTIPAIAQWPESRVKMVSAIVGIALGVITSVLIFFLSKKGGMLKQMFDLKSFSTAIPIFISCLFFWGATLCSLRWLRLRYLESVSTKSLLMDATRFLSATGPQELAAEIDTPTAQVSPLLRRLQAVIRQWLIRPSLQDADLVLQQYVASDEETVHVGYNLIKTFVWALPVLGLIGTVIGISLAVGGFAQFLGGNIEDVAVIKQNLVGVTGGLSFAFLITLQGLMTSLLLMLASSALQTREEKLYAGIQQEIVDNFLPVLQRVAPEPQAGVSAQPQPTFDTGEMAIWRETLQRSATDVLEVIREESTRLMEAIDSRQLIHREQVMEWAQTLRRETEAGAGQLAKSIANIGADVANTNDDFLKRLAMVREAMDMQSARLQELGDTQSRATSQQHSEMMAAMAEQARTVRETSNALNGVAETTRKALECQTALQEAMRQLSESDFERSLTGYVEALSAQSQEVRSTAGAVTELTRAIREVQASQATLQTAITQLRDIGFEQTLASFRDSLASLGPVLSSFREPFVLQAVPTGGFKSGQG